MAFLLLTGVAGVAVFRSAVVSVWVGDVVFDVLALTVGLVSPSPSSVDREGPTRATGASAPPQELPRFEISDLDVPEWSSKERVNIILLGTDKRDDDLNVTRTDTILIVSIDPVSKAAGVLSLPRDLWVNIPGYGFERVNSAFEIGEYTKKGGGPTLLRRTLEGLLGVPMHHYALVGFTGFRKVVDQLGGVVLDVERPFRDDEFPQGNYGMRRIIFQAGLQTLDGEQALWYVRSRHADSDFGRNRRQRQFLLAVRQQALQLNMLPKAPAMLASVMDSVKTDLQTTEILSLARVARDVDTSRLTSRAIDESMVTPWTTPGGAAVLLPEPSAIRHVVQEVFGTPGKLPTLPFARPQAPVATPDIAKSPIASNPRTVVPSGTERARATAAFVPGTGPEQFWITPARGLTVVVATPTRPAGAAVPSPVRSPTAISGAIATVLARATFVGTPVAIATVGARAGTPFVVTPPPGTGAGATPPAGIVPAGATPARSPTAGVAATGSILATPAAPAPTPSASSGLVISPNPATVAAGATVARTVVPLAPATPTLALVAPTIVPPTGGVPTVPLAASSTRIPAMPTPTAPPR